MTEPAPASAPPLPARGTFTPWDSIPPEETAAGLRRLSVHGLAVMGMIALQGGPFLTAFLLELGGTNAMIGLLTSIAFLSQAMQLPGLALVNRYGNRKAITVFSMVAYRLCWLGIALLPLLAPGGGAELVLVAVLVSELVSALSGPAWNSFLRDVVPAEVRGAVMARRLLLGTLASLACTALGGRFVDAWRAAHPGQPLVGYSILFGAGVVCGVVALAAVVGVAEPRLPRQPPTSMATLLRRPLQDENFRKLLVFGAAWSFAANLAGPFFLVYLMKTLGRPLSAVTTLTVVSQVANLASLNIWGRLTDRVSNKSVLAIACPLFLGSVLAWTFVTFPQEHAYSEALLYLIYSASGVSMAGVAVASTNIALELSPDGDAPAYLTVHGLAGAATGALAPLVGGALADRCADLGISVKFHLTHGGLDTAIPTVELAGLDFVFLLAFVVGLYAVHRLAMVREEGEVTDLELRRVFFAEVSTSLRGFSPLPGIRALATVPTLALNRLRRHLHQWPEP